MEAQLAIQVEGLSKVYNLYERPLDRLKESLHPGGRKYHRAFYALRELSFEVRRGQMLGIIGRNGSGKSTLLKLLAGVLTPTTGKAEVAGRVSALLELGTGFNPEFTGMENIYLQGTLMGYTRPEMLQRVQGIVAFADIGEFIDQPVKSYSSGMFVRLAFACAIAVEPDILIVDEALAVGDTQFQSRCYRKIDALRKGGTTVLFVSHDIFTVQSLCDRVILLDAGHLLAAGESKAVVQTYLDLLAKREREEWLRPGQQGKQPAAAGSDTGPAEAEILAVELLDADARPTQVWEIGQAGAVAMTVRFLRKVEKPVPGFLITTPSGINVCGENSWYADCWPDPQGPGDILRSVFSMPVWLTPGSYLVTAAISEYHDNAVVRLDQRLDALNFRVIGPGRMYGGLTWPQIQIAYQPLRAEPAP